MATNDSNFRAKVEQALKRYQERRLPPPYEPSWIHPSYKLLRDWLTGERDNTAVVHELIASFDHADGAIVEALPGLPELGHRIVEDGWTVGTTSWIFERRNECFEQVYRDWVVLSRGFSPVVRTACRELNFPNIDRVWTAFRRDTAKGFGAYLPGIGPAQSRAEIITLIDEEIELNG